MLKTLFLSVVAFVIGMTASWLGILIFKPSMEIENALLVMLCIGGGAALLCFAYFRRSASKS
jgi:hypothetical protein